MPMDLYLAFLAVSAILILTPGPNVALIIANSVAYGPRYGLITILGTASAMVIQLSLTVFGLTALLAALANWFEWLRWIGVAYLVYLGVSALRAAPVDLAQTRAQPKSSRAIFLRGFVVSLTNPKTLLFYGAFLPQFIDRSGAVMPQMVLLSASFLVLATLFDSGYALLAGHFAAAVTRRAAWRNRLTGGLLLAAGLGLALARRP